MLIENAFHYLPEILCGSNYAAQEYEAGIVNAVSLAVLQELNARNVPNPLSALTVEKLYSTNGFARPDDQPKRRYLRTDLFVDTARTFVGTEALSRFGWRHRNYLEAKFFRPGGAPSTTNAAILLGDLVRLCLLTPPTIKGWNYKNNPKPSPCDGKPAQDGKYQDICVGRYLLHVYEGDLDDLVGKRGRTWLKTMREPGDQKKITLRLGDDKADTFRKTLGEELDDLKIDVALTNRVISQNKVTGKTHYLCVLSRVDSFAVTFGDMSWTENESREGSEGTPGDWKKLHELVGKHILFKAKGRTASDEQAEATPPSDNEKENEKANDLIAETNLDAQIDLVAENALNAERGLLAVNRLVPIQNKPVEAKPTVPLTPKD